LLGIRPVCRRESRQKKALEGGVAGPFTPYIQTSYARPVPAAQLTVVIMEEIMQSMVAGALADTASRSRYTWMLGWIVCCAKSAF
jgi:hypothetical protein